MEKSSRYIWQVAGLFATLIIAMAFLAVILFTVKRSVTISQSVMIWVQDVPLFAIFYFINQRFTRQRIGIKPTISWGQLLVVSWPLYLAIAIAVSEIVIDRNLYWMLAISAGLCAGIFEEFLFRGLILGILLKAFRHMTKKRQVWLAVVISSVLFGLIHSVNVLHQPIGDTALQMLFAVWFGLILSVLYLRSGTIILPMLFHGVWDFSIGIAKGSINETATVTLAEIITNVVLFLIVLLICAYCLRQKKLNLINLTKLLA